MKYAAAAALVATVYGADAATKVCDKTKGPIASIALFKTDKTCATAEDAEPAKKSAALVTAANDALKPFLDTCAAVNEKVKSTGPAATHAKVTCAADKLTIKYYTSDKCDTEITPVTTGTVTTYTYKSPVPNTCISTAWDGTTNLADATTATGLAATSLSMKVTFNPLVEAKKDDATTDAKTLGAAVAATTLAVAATLY